MARDHDPLMIKLFKAHEADYHDPSGGSSRVPVVDVTAKLRASLAHQTRKVAKYFSEALSRWPSLPCVAKICLRDTAYAKTKRPAGLFDERSCPIIGGDKLGELYISVTKPGIKRLLHRFAFDETQSGIAQISTVESIVPFERDESLRDEPLAKVKRAAKTGNLKLQLFDHRVGTRNAAVLSAIGDIVDSNNMIRLPYPNGLIVYDLHVPPSRVAKVASFPGTRILAEFATYRVVRTTSRMVGALSTKRFPSPEIGVSYPIVGVIDTGTDTLNPRLEAWIVNRFSFVPDELQDHSHGSFVAGLLCNSRPLNGGDERFPSCSAKIVDVVAFDKSGMASEKQLMQIIRDSVERFPEVRVWNLSFAVVGRVVTDEEFSPLAMLLEELRRKHGVTFVIAAGNNDPDVLPPQSWPRIDDDADRDRICSPADSPTALVVGSVAHLENNGSCVRVDEPSPWTKRGPSAAFLPSPHLAHNGGNCDPENDYARLGVQSIDGHGNVVEDIGTSFSTPLVSSLLANVELDIESEDAPHILSHGILMHSAFLKNMPIDYRQFNYTGVGVPPDIQDVLRCRQSSATAIFQVDFGTKPIAIKEDFPIPNSMKSGPRMLGEILMTLVYDPPVLPQAGFEYCQMNVNVSLGTPNKHGKHTCRVPTWPSFREDTWERDLIRFGFKWAPLKFFYRNFSKDNTLGLEPWRLRLHASCRHGCDFEESHVAYLLITLRDEDESRQDSCKIYDEMVHEFQLRGWAAVDLKLRSRTQMH